MIQFRQSGARALSLMLLAVSLSGCDPIGNGAGPVSFVINSPNGVANADTGKVFVCLLAGVTATLGYEDGSVVNFTARGVNWTSSDESVVKVSNLDTIPLPGVANPVKGTADYYPPGVLIPVAVGTARISASFSKFADYIDITVRPQPTFTVVQKSPQTNIAGPLPADVADPSKRYVRIAPKSIIDLDVVATLDGLPLDVSAAATWSFDAPPVSTPPSPSNDTTALITASTGVITAVDTSTPLRPLTARATFPSCGQSAAATVVVAPLTGVSITGQFGTDPLVVGNVESFTVLGDFGDGPEQDLSLQSLFTSSVPATAAFGGGLLTGATNLLTAVAAGSVNVSAVYNSGTVATPVNATTPTLAITTQTDTLNSISIAPTTVSLLAGASTIVPLTVTGTYASGLTQAITRRALITSDNTTIVQVSNATQTVGQIVSGGPLANVTPAGTTTATVTATVANPASTTTPFTATTAVTTANPAP